MTETITTTPRRPPLDRDQVVAAAVALADLTGIEGVTMRKVAHALGVEAMSLYHHVAGKDDLLDGMVDAVFGEIELPAAGDDWRRAMWDRASSARAVLARHRWAAALMDSRTRPGPATLRHHDQVLGCLRAAGFSVASAAHAVSLIDSYVYGFALQEAALPFEAGGDLESLASAILEGIPSGEYPHFTELVTEHALRPGYDHGAEFGWGLDLLLDGLASRRDR